MHQIPAYFGRVYSSKYNIIMLNNNDNFIILGKEAGSQIRVYLHRIQGFNVTMSNKIYFSIILIIINKLSIINTVIKHINYNIR